LRSCAASAIGCSSSRATTSFFAAQGSPQARFVRRIVLRQPDRLGAARSLPNPANKAVVVEANALLFADIPGYLTRLEIAFRLPFALDARTAPIAESTTASA